MSVKKIFITLITIVACVLIGAFILNILLPNVTVALVDATENMIYNATGMSFDFNGNGNGGEKMQYGATIDKDDMNNDETGTNVNQDSTVAGWNGGST